MPLNNFDFFSVDIFHFDFYTFDIFHFDFFLLPLSATVFIRIFFYSVEGCGKKGSWITLFKIPFENDTYTERGHRKTMSMGKLCGFVEEVDRGLSLPSTFHRRRLRKTLRYAGQ